MTRKELDVLWPVGQDRTDEQVRRDPLYLGLAPVMHHTLTIHDYREGGGSFTTTLALVRHDAEGAPVWQRTG